MKKGLEYNVALALYFLIVIGIVTLEYLLITDKVISILVIFFSISLSVIISFFIEFGYESKTSLSYRKKYQELKSKENRTNFEELYLLAFQSKADDILKEYISKNKIKGVESLDVYIGKLNEIEVFYRYSGFEVTLTIQSDKTNYQINSPMKYDAVKENQEFEKMKNTDININLSSSIESFFIEVVSFIKEENKVILDYIDRSNVDPVFNGRLFHKLDYYKKVLKDFSIVYLVFSVVFLIGTIVMIIDVINKTNDEAIYGLVAFSAAFLSLLCGSILNLRNLSLIRSDIENKRTSQINGKPKKARVLYTKLNKHSPPQLLCIELTFDKLKLVIPFEDGKYFLKTGSLKRCNKKLSEITRKLTYLEKSKVVILGSEEYKKVVFQEFL